MEFVRFLRDFDESNFMVDAYTDIRVISHAPRGAHNGRLKYAKGESRERSEGAGACDWSVGLLEPIVAPSLDTFLVRVATAKKKRDASSSNETRTRSGSLRELIAGAQNASNETATTAPPKTSIGEDHDASFVDNDHDARNDIVRATETNNNDNESDYNAINNSEGFVEENARTDSSVGAKHESEVNATEDTSPLIAEDLIDLFSHHAHRDLPTSSNANLLQDSYFANNDGDVDSELLGVKVIAEQ